MFPVVLPILLISIGYVDPGKWVATVEGGARFGFDLVVPMLLFNCAAILCQYLSARIGVVTGRGLGQICSDKYDKSTQLFLGVQVELSVVALDLTMVLGVAHGINLLFGMDLSTGVFLAALDAVLFPVFASTLSTRNFYFMLGMPTKLSGESAFALMSLLGASIMPYNFYLHYSIVQLIIGLQGDMIDGCENDRSSGKIFSKGVTPVMAPPNTMVPTVATTTFRWSADGRPRRFFDG
ncbi:hypothetical protein Gotur_031127 [Gossypium turneri]